MLVQRKKLTASTDSESSTQSIISITNCNIYDKSLLSPSVLEVSIIESCNNFSSSYISRSYARNYDPLSSKNCTCLLF